MLKKINIKIKNACVSMKPTVRLVIILAVCFMMAGWSVYFILSSAQRIGSERSNYVNIPEQMKILQTDSSKKLLILPKDGIER